MKKIILFVLLVNPIYYIYCQKISLASPVATVKYLKTKSIYGNEIKKKIAFFKKAFGRSPALNDLKQIVNSEIDQELFLQEVQKLGFKVEPQELTKEIEKQKSSLGAGQNISDSDFIKLVEQQTGATYSDYKKNMKIILLQQKYILSKYPNLFKNIKKPSQKEIEDFYDSNVQQFLSPSVVRFEQIFFDTHAASTTQKRTYKNRIEAFYKNIKTGGKSVFDKYVTDSLSDPSYQGGDAGLMPLSNKYEQSIVQNIGQEFLDNLKRLRVGEFSEIISSKIGYHIIYITDKRKPKLLGINDSVSPGNSTTVKEYIQNVLMSQNQQKLFMSKISQFINTIRKKAKIKINESQLKSL